MSSARVFLAIPLDTQLKRALGELQNQLAEEVAGVRWSRPQALHLTLHFFGDTTQENLEKIKVSMLSVKRCFRPFSVNIKGLGGFPRLHRSRVIWLGIEPDTQIKLLHRDIQQSLQDVDLLTDQRPFSPHLTLGRVRKGVVDISKPCVTLSDTTVGHLEIDRMILFESSLRPGGAEHIPLFTVNFDEETGNLS